MLKSGTSAGLLYWVEGSHVLQKVGKHEGSTTLTTVHVLNQNTSKLPLFCVGRRQLPLYLPPAVFNEVCTGTSDGVDKVFGMVDA